MDINQNNHVIVLFDKNNLDNVKQYVTLEEAGRLARKETGARDILRGFVPTVAAAWRINDDDPYEIENVTDAVNRIIAEHCAFDREDDDAQCAYEAPVVTPWDARA